MPARLASLTAALAVALFAIPILIDLLASGRERPFGYLAADSLVYFDYSGVQATTPPEEVRNWVKKSNLAVFGDPSRYEFTVDYPSDAINFAIIRADPLPETVAASPRAAGD